MSVFTVTDLVNMAELERHVDAREPADSELEARFRHGSPHAFEAHPGYPAWCAHCPEPREHSVHFPAAEGERP